MRKGNEGAFKGNEELLRALRGLLRVMRRLSRVMRKLLKPLGETGLTTLLIKLNFPLVFDM